MEHEILVYHFVRSYPIAQISTMTCMSEYYVKKIINEFLKPYSGEKEFYIIVESGLNKTQDVCT